jgi:dTDP-4-amino-4,6-dideoxygalactose transaminase
VTERIPVMRPLLPSAERLRPYLERIDASRIYSNFGPLVLELESRLAQRLRLPAGGVTSAANGTAALSAAILATAGRASSARPLALMPSFTFVATAVAAEQCGFRPYLLDIDPESLLLDAARSRRSAALPRAGVIIPVAAFGRAVPQAPWEEFQRLTGVPVVIDGAASLELLGGTPERYLGRIPVAVSFHATKSFATGEGGGALSADVGLVARIASALNFGFQGTRDCICPSFNGKMSEYHAAIGLAELDGWAEKQSAFRVVADTYRQVATTCGLAARLLAAPEIGSNYLVFRCRDGSEAESVTSALRRGGVDFRLWYGEGLHRQSYFSTSEREDLGTTERTAPCLLGLPVATDMSRPTIERVILAADDGVRAAREAQTPIRQAR